MKIIHLSFISQRKNIQQQAISLGKESLLTRQLQPCSGFALIVCLMAAHISAKNAVLCPASRVVNQMIKGYDIVFFRMLRNL